MVLFVPMRCNCGAVIAQVKRLKMLSRMKQEGIPMDKILDAIGFPSETQICCRNLFLTTVELHSNFLCNHEHPNPQITRSARNVNPE